MQIVKLIVGLSYFVLALCLALLALAVFTNWGWVDLPFTVTAILFATMGWFLISRRKLPLSKGRTFMLSMNVPLWAYLAVILIPNFIRMGYEGPENSCVNNLRQLEAAKQEWALETGATNGTLVTANDITPYIQLDSNGKLPHCPAGGTYIFGRIGEDVKCSIGTSDWPNSHTLSDTNDFDWWTNCKEAYRVLFGLRHIRKR